MVNRLGVIVGRPYNDSVVPGENCKLIEACDEVPSSGYVAGYEDSEGEGREGVHRIASPLAAHAETTDGEREGIDDGVLSRAHEAVFPAIASPEETVLEDAVKRGDRTVWKNRELEVVEPVCICSKDLSRLERYCTIYVEPPEST